MLHSFIYGYKNIKNFKYVGKFLYFCDPIFELCQYLFLTLQKFTDNNVL